MGRTKKNAGAELEIAELLNEIKSSPSTAELLSSQSKRTLEMFQNDDNVSNATNKANIVMPDIIKKESTETTNEQIKEQILEPAFEEDKVNETVNEQAEKQTAELAIDDNLTESSNEQMEVKATEISKDENTTCEELKNGFYIIKNRKNIRCYAGRHSKEKTQTLATIRFNIDNEVKFINYCESCFIEFFELIQEFYVNDDKNNLKTTDKNFIKMSISEDTSNKCKFCDIKEEKTYIIKVKNVSAPICKTCMNKLINKMARFLLNKGLQETIETIIHYFEKNNISYSNICAFNKNQVNTTVENSLDEKIKLVDEHNKQLSEIKDKSQRVITDYQTAIRKRDNKIQNLHKEIDRLNRIVNDDKIKIKELTDKVNYCKNDKYMIDTLQQELNVVYCKLATIHSECDNSTLTFANRLKRGKIFINSTMKSIKEIIEFIK